VFQVLVNGSDDIDTKLDLMEGKLDKVEADLAMSRTKLDEIGKKMEPLLQYIKEQGPTNTSESTTSSPGFQINDLLQFGNLVVDFSDTAAKLQGILVVGGLSTDRSAEVFIPANGKSCLFPDLPHETKHFTMDLVGDLPTLCGSMDYLRPFKSCVQLTPPSRHGKWTKYAQLEKYRENHSSWVSSSGLVIIGGMRGGKTTQLVPDGGKNFTLQRVTRNACAITAQDSVILTGGITLDEIRDKLVVTSGVARYNLQGFVENLPDMNTKRYNHACGSYTSEGKQVLIAAGGELDNAYRSNEPPLSSSEKLVTGSTAWIATKPLPRILTEMASVSMNNKVYILGGEGADYREPRAEILAFDGEDWKEVGKMKKERSWHSASKIVSIDGEELCL